MVCRGKRNGLEGSSAPHQRTSEASAGCAARRTSTTNVEVAGSRKSRKSYRQIAIFTLQPSQQHIQRFFFFARCCLSSSNCAPRLRFGSWKRCSSRKCVGVILCIPSKREKGERKKKKKHPVCPSHIISLTTQTLVHLATSPPHLRFLHCWWHGVQHQRETAAARLARECSLIIGGKIYKRLLLLVVKLQCSAHQRSHIVAALSVDARLVWPISTTRAHCS